MGTFLSPRTSSALSGAVLDFVWMKGCPDCRRAKPVVQKAAGMLGVALRMHEINEGDPGFPVGVVPAMRLVAGSDERHLAAAPDTVDAFTTLNGMLSWLRGAVPRAKRRRAFGYVTFGR